MALAVAMNPTMTAPTVTVSESSMSTQDVAVPLRTLNAALADQYRPYVLAAAYMATMLSVGELSCRQWVGAKQ